LSAVVRALEFAHATSALIVARSTILVARATMRLIDYLGWSINNALDRISRSIDRHRCLSPCVPFRCLILQRCCHVSLNTCALNGSNDFFSYLFASSTKNTAFYLKVLQDTETPKLTKKSENNKAKGLTNAN
jgi:hypothetical protein